jgi:outer membrane protein assembly factor BamB
VRILRTTISCVAIALFVAISRTDVRAAGLTFPLQAAWIAALSAPPAFPPAYNAAHAYIALRDNQLAAIVLETGRSAWSVDCPARAAPVAGDSLVFVGGDGFVEARSQADGSRQWRSPIAGVVTRLHWDTGWLIATTETGALLALRAADGDILWTRDLASPPQSTPATAGDHLYVSLQNGEVMSLILQTGEPLWTTPLGSAGTDILALDDRVFVGSLDNVFYCLSTRNGNIVWRWRTGADVIGMPAIDARRVYFVSLDNVLRALDRRHGSVLWMKSLPMRPSSGPLLSGSTVIVAGVSSELHAFLSADGKPAGDLVLKSAEGQEMPLAAPPHLTQDDRVILLTRGGRMQALTSTPPPAGP